MRKNFISSNTAIGFMAFTLLLTGMTGCYKDQRLDVTEPGTGPVVTPDAAYSISGTVTDAETGQSVDCTVTASVGTPTGGSGAYNVALTKAQVGEGVNVDLTFTAEGYTTTKRSVYVQRINDGSSIVYPVSVSLKKEYVTISGYVTDVNNKMVTAREISVTGSDVEPKYNASTFSFKMAKESGVSEYTVEAVVLDYAGDKYTASKKIVLEDNKLAYNGINLQFNLPIDNDGQIEIGGDDGYDAAGVIVPEVDEETGLTVKEEKVEMKDGTTVTIPKGTKIENLNGKPVTVFSHASNTTDEGTGESTETDQLLRTFTGTPDGAKFTPALQINYSDKYEGQLGNAFVLQYQNADYSWTTEEGEKLVELKDGAYTMHVPHFSVFRAALSVTSEVKTSKKEETVKIDVNRMNNLETPLEDFELRYNGKEGSVYADFSKLESDVKASFTNAEAQKLVLSTIKDIDTDANKGLTDKEYTGVTDIPAWTLLNYVNVTTTTEVKEYTVTVNGKSIKFTVNRIESVEISADKECMTHIGHSHGDGNGDLNNAGGGIVVGE